MRSRWNVVPFYSSQEFAEGASRSVATGSCRYAEIPQAIVQRQTKGGSILAGAFQLAPQGVAG